MCSHQSLRFYKANLDGLNSTTARSVTQARIVTTMPEDTSGDYNYRVRYVWKTKQRGSLPRPSLELPKPSKDTPSHDIQGVLVTPGENYQLGKEANLSKAYVPARLLSSAPDLSLPGELGLPLKYVKVHVSHPSRAMSINHLVQVLTLRFSERPEKQRAHPLLRGGIVVVRSDEKPLRQDILEVLAAYINEYLAWAVTYATESTFRHFSPDQMDKCWKQHGDVLCAKRFAKYWWEYRKAMVEAGEKRWESLSCPVEIEGRGRLSRVRGQYAQ